MKRFLLARRYHVLSTAAIVILIDQLSKIIAQNLLFNSGIAFSLQIGQGWEQIALLLLILIVAVAVGWQTWQKYPVPLGLFVGGAVSNILDRVFIGAVRDWMPVPFFSITNNLADWAIAGAVLAFLWLSVSSREEKNV